MNVITDIIIVSVYFAYSIKFFAKYKEAINLITISYETTLHCSNLYPDIKDTEAAT